MLLGFVLFFVLYYLLIGRHITLENIRLHSSWIQQSVQEHYITTVIIYIAVFSVLISFVLPVMIPLTLMSGYLFGTWCGALYALISAMIGCITSFLVFRYILDKKLHRRYGDRLKKLHDSMEHYGPTYILILHYSAIVPLFIINSSAALTHMRLWVFLLMSMLGLLPVCIIYSFAGRELATIQSFGSVFSAPVILALSLLLVLALLPIIVRSMQKKR